jgi:hypothetical protein
MGKSKCRAAFIRFGGATELYDMTPKKCEKTAWKGIVTKVVHQIIQSILMKYDRLAAEDIE